MSSTKPILVRISREAITVIALTFGLFHAVIGFLSLNLYTSATLPSLAIAVYLGALISSIVFYRNIRLPWAHALFALIAAAAIPLMVTPFIREHAFDTYATWYVGASGVLFSAVIVRQRPIFAWIGAAAVFTETLMWAGSPEVIQQSGLLGGMVILMMAGQAISIGVERNARDANTINVKTAAERARAEAATARRSERRKRVAAALRKARPILEAAAKSKSKFAASLQVQAEQAALELRDIIQGRELVTKEMARAVFDARERGVSVVFNDLGGMRQLDEETKARVFKDAVAAIDSVQRGRITIRSPRKEEWALSIMVTEPGETVPKLWLRLP